MNRKFQIVGQLISGNEVLTQLENASSLFGKPTTLYFIQNCGISHD